MSKTVIRDYRKKMCSMLTWTETKYDNKFKDLTIVILDEKREITTCELSWYGLWTSYDPLNDGTPADYLQAQKFDEVIAEAINREDYYDEDGYNVSSLTKEIVNHYTPKIMEEVPQIAWQIEHKYNRPTLCFKSDADFIAFTIEWIKDDSELYQSDEYSTMTGYGFVEVIDKENYNEDGEIIDCQSHWEGNIEVCVKFWEKQHAKVNRILNFKETLNEK